MQFSIFNVLFKCTKDMFTWEKVKWTIFVYWAQLWRVALFGVGSILLFAGIFFLPVIINSDELVALTESAEPSVRSLVPLVYASQYWAQQMFAPGIIFLCLGIVGLILGAIYIQYYTFFKKSYRSFDKHFNQAKVQSFWSGGFWKPFMLITVFGLLIGGLVGFLLGEFMVYDGLIQLISLSVGLVLFHIFLHGGTWGFVPVRKQPKSDMSEVKS